MWKNQMDLGIGQDGMFTQQLEACLTYVEIKSKVRHLDFSHQRAIRDFLSGNRQNESSVLRRFMWEQSEEWVQVEAEYRGGTEI